MVGSDLRTSNIKHPTTHLKHPLPSCTNQQQVEHTLTGLLALGLREEGLEGQAAVDELRPQEPAGLRQVRLRVRGDAQALCLKCGRLIGDRMGVSRLASPRVSLDQDP
jgi:hypothetical protein